MRMRYDDHIRLRVPRDLREHLDKLAAQRFLDASDVMREAFREYAARNPIGQRRKQTFRAAA